MKIDTANQQFVGLQQGELIVVLRPVKQMTADEALTHAAHLVALAEPFATVEFKDVLNAVKHT